MALLSLQNIRLSFSGLPVLDGISLNIEEGDRYCLIGRNGEGKTSLMRIIEGQISADAGEVSKKQGIKISSVPQDIPEHLGGSVAGVVSQGLGAAAALIARYLELSSQLGQAGTAETAKLMQEMDRLHTELEAAKAWDIEQAVGRVMTELHLDGQAEFISLSGGTKRRVLLARALVGQPDILLLDEPTNHLDLDTILWLEGFLANRGGALLFVTHDRAFARRLANRVGEIDRGNLISFNGGYDQFIAKRDDLLESERRQRLEMGKKLAQEEAWIRRGVKARRTRDEGRVKALVEMRRRWQELRQRSGTASLRIVDAQRSGDLVMSADGVGFNRGERCIIKDFNADILRGDRVGIMGPNGSGKTTLLRLLLGELQPDRGSVRQGHGLQVVYFDQMRAGLDPQATVFQSIAGGDDCVLINGVSRHVNAYLQDFLFSPERGRARVHSLSGGERNRLLLAKLFTQPANLIVLDEPTNDLDAETMDLLEDLLLEFRGTVLLVSHDRDFLDQVVTYTLVIGPDGGVGEFAGGYSDWLLQRKPAATTPAKANEAKASGLKPAPAAAKAEKPKSKLSYKETQELAGLPQAIAELEQALALIHQELADPKRYQGGAQDIAQTTAKMAEVEAKIAAAYARWEELEARA